jgi:FkbM family methyltransferase
VWAPRGWTVLTEAVHRRRRGLPDVARHTTPAGVTLELELDDYVQRSIYYDAWELPELRLTRQVLGPGDTMVDVGANVGLFALTAAAGGAEVHAFEPVPANLERLRRNLALNPGLPVHVVPAAVGEEDGRATFGTPDAPTGASTSGGFYALGGQHAQVEADVLRLDGYLERQGVARVHLLKADVEGAEPLVLRGAAGALAEQRVDVVLLEASIYTLAPLQLRFADLVEPLASAGYVLFRFAPRGRLRPWTLTHEPQVPDLSGRRPGLLSLLRSGWEDRDRHFNLVAVRRSHPALVGADGRLAIAELRRRRATR